MDHWRQTVASVGQDGRSALALATAAPRAARALRVLSVLAPAALILSAAAVVSRWDHLMIGLVTRHNPMDDVRVAEFIRVFKGLGKTDGVILTALFLGVFGMRRRAVRVLLAVAVVSAMVLPTKAIVGRERPSGRDNYSFPSGDAATAAAAAMLLGGAAPVLVPAAAGATVIVAGGRVLDLDHYPSDVIAGIAFGVAAAAAAGVIRRRLALHPGRRFFLVALAAFGLIYVPLLLFDFLVKDFVDYWRIWGPALLFLSTTFLWRRVAIRSAPERRGEGTAR